MEPLQTSKPAKHIRFKSYYGEKRTCHTLVFYRGYCVQHIFEMRWHDPEGSISIDLSEHSAFTGKTSDEIRIISKDYKFDPFHSTAWFSEREPDMIEYLCDRWAWFQDWTCDHDYAAGFIQALRKDPRS